MFRSKCKFQTGKFLKGRQPSREEIQYDLSNGLYGIFIQLFGVVCRKDCETKRILLAYVNGATKAISKVLDENVKVDHFPSDIFCCDGISDGCTFSGSDISGKRTHLLTSCQIFCLLRCVLIHHAVEVHAAGLRLARHLTKTKQDVEALVSVQFVPLIIRCIDIDNKEVRIQGLRLAHHMLMVAPDIFPEGLLRCIVSMVNGVEQDKDELLYSALALLNEILVLNTELFVKCGGITTVLHKIISCDYPRIIEALMGGFFYAINFSKWRPYFLQLHMILTPLSCCSFVYGRHGFASSSESDDNSDLRAEAGMLAVLAALRSWPGLVFLCQPACQGLHSVVKLLYSPREVTRRIVVELLYDLFRINFGGKVSSYKEALKAHFTVLAPDSDQWTLHEGFVVAEGTTLLPSITRYRPNLILNHLVCVLYALIWVGVFPALSEVIVSSSNYLSIKATILVGELLNMAGQNLPSECLTECHALSTLVKKVTDEDPTRRNRAVESVLALLKLSHIYSTHEVKVQSVYLEQILLNSSYYRRKNRRTHAVSSKLWIDKMYKWIEKDKGAMLLHTIKQTGVLSYPEDPCTWNWHLIKSTLQWPSRALLKSDDANCKLFIQRILHFFKPSASLFSLLDINYHLIRVKAETLIILLSFLLKASLVDDNNKCLEEFLTDIVKHLNKATSSGHCLLNGGTIFSAASINSTGSQYYFLALGSLIRTPEGYDKVYKAGILEEFLELVTYTTSDVYAKLIITCLDYSYDGLNRVILNKVLTGCKEPVRLYATQWLRILLRIEVEDFYEWGVKMIVMQLSDESRIVTNAALDVLNEACDNEDCLNSILSAPRALFDLGDKGFLLLAKFLSSPKGFQCYSDCKFIEPLLDKWASVYNLKYVKLVQTAVDNSMSQHHPDEFGKYGRRTGSKHIVHDVYILPHLYGSLAQHKDGFAVLMEHNPLQDIVQTVLVGSTDTLQEIYRLKAAIWALGHIGTSKDGVTFLMHEGILHRLVHLAAQCEVYSVRGTCFHAICLVATTSEGTRCLRNFGWFSVHRHHHEKSQFRLDDWLGVDSSLMPTHCDGSVLIPRIRTTSEITDTAQSTSLALVEDSEEESHTQGGTSLNTSRDAEIVLPKAQTLPPNMKPPYSMGHHRSFSDNISVTEDKVPASSWKEESRLHRNSFRVKSRRILRAIKKGSRSRQESTSSRTSNSSGLSDKLGSWFRTRRRRLHRSSRSESFTDHQLSGDESNDLSYTVSSGSFSDGWNDDFLSSEFYYADPGMDIYPISQSISAAGDTHIRMEHQLTPIASGGTLSVCDSKKVLQSPEECFSNVDGDTSIANATESPRNAFPSPVNSGHSFFNVSSSKHCRLTSESSGNDYIGASPTSYVHVNNNTLETCSASSPGGSEPILHSTSLSPLTHSYDCQNCQQRYMGMAIPLNINALLYDHAINGTSFEAVSSKLADISLHPGVTQFSSKVDTKFAEEDLQPASEVKDCKELHPESGLKLHKPSLCIGCFSLFPESSRQDVACNAHSEESSSVILATAASPSLLRVKALSDFISEVPDSSSINSQDFDEQGVTVIQGQKYDRTYFRKKILQLIGTPSESSGLELVQQKCPEAFDDPCLYSEVNLLLSHYNFKLSSRRLIQRLFLDTKLDEIFIEARLVLSHLKDTRKDPKGIVAPPPLCPYGKLNGFSEVGVSDVASCKLQTAAGLVAEGGADRDALSS